MDKTWTTLIIDDEPLARQRLKRLLKDQDTIQVVGEAENGADGLMQIRAMKPELIFLDIEMPVFNGFQMLSQLTDPPKVIFTTAYDQYAVKAFEEESIDYLLKPIEAERLAKAVMKLRHKQENFLIPLELLMKQLNLKKEIKSLSVKIGDRIILVRLQELSSIEAEDKYVFLNTEDGKRHLTDFTLAALIEKLPDTFVRISRGTIINTDLIREIRKSFNGTYSFLMKNAVESKLQSSRSYGTALRERFDL
jgi:two-component system LytT family response regulator